MADNKFRIGLCMAGAISAGAYTAGAMDFLLETLDEWERRKQNGTPNTPGHEVEIPIMGGASAGGMTTLMASVVANSTLTPIRKAGADMFAPRKDNLFYHSWVDLVSDDMLSELLKTDDLSSGAYSMLNSNFISSIANRALKAEGEPLVRNYFPDGLQVFTTLSNLEGMTYSYEYQTVDGDLNKYVIRRHHDFACFRMVKKETDYKNDGWIPLNYHELMNLEIAREAAMGTGAFPIGLKARSLNRQGKYMKDHAWFKEIESEFPADYHSENIDGGMINNEPFERVYEILMEKAYPDVSKKNLELMANNYENARAAIILIDPFPSETAIYKKGLSIADIAGKALSTLISQNRMKSKDIIDILDDNKASTYMISPVRYSKDVYGNDTKISGDKAIACGTLGGFGGFISKEFRIHDYFLGRMNCERMLTEYFTFPVDTQNPILKAGYENVTDITPFLSSDGKSLQIIPVFNRSDSQYMPTFRHGKQWPIQDSELIKGYRSAIKTRVSHVVAKIAGLNWFTGMLANWVVNGRIADSAVDTILKSLKDHKLLKF